MGWEIGCSCVFLPFQPYFRVGENEDSWRSVSKPSLVGMLGRHSCVRVLFSSFRFYCIVTFLFFISIAFILVTQIHHHFLVYRTAASKVSVFVCMCVLQKRGKKVVINGVLLLLR